MPVVDPVTVDKVVAVVPDVVVVVEEEEVVEEVVERCTRVSCRPRNW